MDHLPFLLVHGLKLWLALAALAVLAGAWRAMWRLRRRARAQWRSELDALEPCSPEDNWTGGQEVTISGELVGGAITSRRYRSGEPVEEDTGEPVEEGSPAGLALRTGAGTSVRVRARLSLRCGSVVSVSGSRAAHSLATGEPVRLRGRLDQVAGEGEAGFRESAHRWELAAPGADPSISAVTEKCPVVRRSPRSLALGGLVGLLAFATCSSAVSAIAYRQIAEHLSIIRGLPWEYHDELEVRPEAAIAAASPIYRRRTLSRLGREFEIHDSTGRSVIEASVTSYHLAGECDAAARAAFGRGAPDLALEAAACASMPASAHMRATALYQLGRFAEASEAIAQVTEPIHSGLPPEALVEAAEMHLLAGRAERATRALDAYARTAPRQAKRDDAREAAQLADAVRARAGDAAARRRLVQASGAEDAVATLLLADATPKEGRLPLLAQLPESWPLGLNPEWAETAVALLELEATGRVSEAHALDECVDPPHSDEDDVVLDVAGLDRRGSLLEGLASAVLARLRVQPRDQPSRNALACAGMLLAEYLAGIGRPDDATKLIDRWSNLPAFEEPWQTDWKMRHLILRGGLALRGGDRKRASALAAQAAQLDEDAARSALVQAFRVAPGSPPPPILGDLSATQVAAALRGDGRALLSALVDKIPQVPGWLFLLAPRIEHGADRLLDMVLHRETFLVRSARGFASTQLQVSMVMRSEPMIAKWKPVVDRHVAAELRRDTTVVLELMRALLGTRLQRSWID
jgi:tetratricopeptide (TPR) repeat protein